MPSTLGGQLTIISLAIVIAGVAYKGIRYVIVHLEWMELFMIDYAKRTGYPISEDVVKKHMQINGNAKRSDEEKDRLYGKAASNGE